MFDDKWWMRPVQYTDGGNAGAPAEDAATQVSASELQTMVTVDEPDRPLRMESDRVEKMASKPVGGLRDNEPMVYRTGNPEAVFGLSDDDYLED
jgi:hypothetical protein